jgi:hypothetical protein
MWRAILEIQCDKSNSDIAVAFPTFCAIPIDIESRVSFIEITGTHLDKTAQINQTLWLGSRECGDSS